MFGCPEIKFALIEGMNAVSERQDEDRSIRMAAWWVRKT